MVTTPRLIVFEGADAVGKFEMSTRLVDEINKMPGRKAKRFGFPRYETPVGKAILRHLKKEVSLTEKVKIPMGALADDFFTTAPEDALVFQCMMIADKCEAAMQIKQAMVADGYDVICDRWWQSAYAFGTSDGLDKQWLLDVHEMLPQGDINILLDVSAEVSASRRPAFRDRYETDRPAQERIRGIYRDLWTEKAKGRTPDDMTWTVIDAGQTRDEVFKQILDAYQWQ
jgi:thymidylate kinase